MVRLIPRLDIKGASLVKGVHLEGLRVLGQPNQFAKYYYEQGADELILMDVVASLYERNSLHEIIKNTAYEIFIPLAVGGGIRTLKDIDFILRAGADKVIINTAAIKNPEFIKEASKVYGSSTIIVAIEAIKQNDGEYYAFTDNGREFTGKNVLYWAKEVQELGAGEIVITSVDNEGTGKGFDIDLVNSILNIVSIPLVAHGGAGNVNQVCELAEQKRVSGLAISSMFHYEAVRRMSLNESIEGNLDFLKSGKEFTKVVPISIGDLKKKLIDKDIEVRYE